MKRKVKRYEGGGYLDSDDAKNLMAASKREAMDYSRSQISDEPGATESIRQFVERTKTPAKTAKAPIVTKEQMKSAGFDNLRDYLNAQRGLTRRGSAASPVAPAAPAPKSMGPSSQDIDRMESALTASNIRDERRAYEQGKDATAAAKRAADMQKERAAYMKEQARKKEDTQTGSERLARKAEAFRTRMREQAGGMKKGGMVASKRADGIAQRGKTRGRII